MSQLQVSRVADLYLAADDAYLDIARKKGLLRETIPVANMAPVIVVPRGNPKAIGGVADLSAAVTLRRVFAGFLVVVAVRMMFTTRSSNSSLEATTEEKQEYFGTKFGEAPYPLIAVGCFP